MPAKNDGPRCPSFSSITFRGKTTLALLDTGLLSSEMAAVLIEASEGSCTGWGIPFEIDQVALA